MLEVSLQEAMVNGELSRMLELLESSMAKPSLPFPVVRVQVNHTMCGDLYMLSPGSGNTKRRGLVKVGVSLWGWA